MFVIILKVGRSEWCDTFEQEDKEIAVERLNKIADHRARYSDIRQKACTAGSVRILDPQKEKPTPTTHKGETTHNKGPFLFV